jgi:hypothetical protein
MLSDIGTGKRGNVKHFSLTSPILELKLGAKLAFLS